MYKCQRKGTSRHGRAGRPVQKAHWLPISVLLDHGQVGVQADAHGGVKGHLEGSAVVLGADHGPQLLAVHGLLDFIEEALEGLPVIVSLELQANTSMTAQSFFKSTEHGHKTPKACSKATTHCQQQQTHLCLLSAFTALFQFFSQDEACDRAMTTTYSSTATCTTTVQYKHCSG